MTDTDQDDGAPAFPVVAQNNVYATGMTLRDWFAGQADVAAYTPIQSFRQRYDRLPTISELAAYIAEIRFIEADAMLEARKK